TSSIESPASSISYTVTLDDALPISTPVRSSLTLTTKLTDWLPPTATSARFQVIIPLTLSWVPPLAALTKVVLAGTASVITRPSKIVLPDLLTPIVYDSSTPDSAL